jgi:hypothetical protein
MENRRNRFATPLIALAVAGVAWGMVTYRAYSWSAAADAELARGNVFPAIISLERSALWYAPLNPYWRASYDKLKELAAGMESQHPSLSHHASQAAKRVEGQIYPFGPDGTASMNNPGGVGPVKRALISLALLGFFAGALHVFFRGFDSTGAMNAPHAVAGFAFSVLSATAWLFLLAS